MRIAVLSTGMDGIEVAAKLQQEGNTVLLFCPEVVAEAAEMFYVPLTATPEMELARAFEAELFVVLEADLGKVPGWIGSDKAKVFGFSPLTQNLKYDPAWGPTLLQRLGVTVTPFQRVKDADELKQWVIGQDAQKISVSSPYLKGRTTQEFDTLGSLLQAADDLAYPATVRPVEDGDNILRFAMLFSGRNVVRPALLLQPKQFDGYDNGPYVGLEMLPMALNDQLSKVTKKLEDVFLSLRYVGFIFLDIKLSKGTTRNPVKMEVVNLSTEAPVGFWAAFCQLLNQPLTRVLQSCATGAAQFTPRLRPYAYAYGVLSSRWLYRDTDSLLHPIYSERPEFEVDSWHYFHKEDQYWSFGCLAGMVVGNHIPLGDATVPKRITHNTQWPQTPFQLPEDRKNLVALLDSFGLHLMLEAELKKLEEEPVVAELPSVIPEIAEEVLVNAQ